MAAKKCRIVYWVSFGIVLVLLFFFSQLYLAVIAIAMLLLAVLSALCLAIDCKRMSIQAKVDSKRTPQNTLPLMLTVRGPSRLLSAKYVQVSVEIINAMFGTVQTQVILLPLRHNELSFDTQISMDGCGEILVRCIDVKACDLLELFSVRMDSFDEARTIVYPHKKRVSLAMEKTAVGSAQTGSSLQNRHGNDPSETYDMREYSPGDDIRAIHWKLSSKYDTLYLRQSSEPSHYDVMLMPDLGMTHGDAAVPQQELNAAVAVTIALGEQLLRNGIMFCLAIPTSHELNINEIRNAQELSRMLNKWLSVQVQPVGGTGIRFFRSEHLEQHFSRLILVSAGEFPHELSALDNHVGVTAVCANDVEKVVYTALSPTCEAVNIPADPENDEICRIICKVIS